MKAARAEAAVVALVALALAAPADARKGAVAFHYGGPLTATQLVFYSRFEVLVTHDPLPPMQVAALRKAGTRLALYEWSVAFYGSLARPWQKRLPLLNTRGLRGGSGASDADAFYYDPATDEHRDVRPKAIAERLREIGYDGVFLDTTTRAHVHRDALAVYEQRHPGTPYDVAFARFLKNLRAAIPLIVTNQGYIDAKHYLPYADFDVTESLIARNGKLRAWHDPLDLWNSIDHLMKHVIAPAKREYPRVRFVHLNYTNEVVPVVAIARLFGDDAFVATNDITGIPSDAYFRDFGKAEPSVRGEGTAYRWFARMLVAINAGEKPLTIRTREGTLIDVATGERIAARRVVLAPGSVRMFARERP